MADISAGLILAAIGIIAGGISLALTRIRTDFNPYGRIAMAKRHEREGQWGYSFDEENYYGNFDTKEEAIDEGIDEAETDEHRSFTVGQYRAPQEPQVYLDADLVFDHVLCQDDYSCDFADGTFGCSKEQRADLTRMLQEAFVTWMDKHEQWPRFGLVDHKTIERIVVPLKEPSDGRA